MPGWIIENSASFARAFRDATPIHVDIEDEDLYVRLRRLRELDPIRRLRFELWVQLLGCDELERHRVRLDPRAPARAAVEAEQSRRLALEDDFIPYRPQAERAHRCVCGASRYDRACFCED